MRVLGRSWNPTGHMFDVVVCVWDTLSLRLALLHPSSGHIKRTSRCSNSIMSGSAWRRCSLIVGPLTRRWLRQPSQRPVISAANGGDILWCRIRFFFFLCFQSDFLTSAHPAFAAGLLKSLNIWEVGSSSITERRVWVENKQKQSTFTNRCLWNITLITPFIETLKTGKTLLETALTLTATTILFVVRQVKLHRLKSLLTFLIVPLFHGGPRFWPYDLDHHHGCSLPTMQKLALLQLE